MKVRFFYHPPVFKGGSYVTAKRGNKGQLKRTKGGVTGKFIRMSELYRHFAKGWDGLDFSEKSLVEMFNSESYGTPVDQKKNGFYVGKQWLNVSVAMWLEDIAKGHLPKYELYSDPNLPHWWLDGILK